MGMTVLSHPGQPGAAEVLFFCADARTVNLANYYLRWLPIVPELRALERAMQQIAPGLRIRWSPKVEKFWSQYDPGLALASEGMALSASPWMSLGVEACHCLPVLNVIPVVTLQIAGNPRAAWIMGSLLLHADRPPESATWSCRPHDLLAIARMIGRVADVTVTAPRQLLEETEREFQDVEPVPKSRLRQ